MSCRLLRVGALLLLASLVWCQGEGPAYTAEQAAGWLAEVRPLVEEAARRRLGAVPAVRVVSRREFVEALARELGGGELDPDARLLLTRMAGAALGKYGPATGTLYLLPDNLAPVLTRAGVPRAHHLAIAKLLVAHELCHALQEQEVRLSALLAAAAADPEALLACNAVLEGHATDITERVAAALRLDAAAEALARAYVLERLGPEDAAVDLMGGHMARVGEALYRDGRAFIAGQAALGGVERVWAVLANPPRRTAALYRPERAAQDLPDDTPALARACALLGTPDAPIAETGELLLRANYANMPPATRARILDDLRIARGGAVAEHTTLTLFRFNDAETARLLLDAGEALAAHNADRLRESPRTQRVDGPTTRDLPGLPGARALRLSYRLREPGAVGPTQTLSVYRATRGPRLAELVAQGDPPADEVVARVLGEMLGDVL